ncbi:hypothetical protein LTR86_001701 [Recurvomyces mirabilis]|nr:hypothetical protein LTR86_001701 [Recurvomyces mirabilis]
MSKPTTASTCPLLLTIPPEIRLKVYALVFSSAKPTIISKHHAIPPNQYPPLLLTCKAIHDEAYPEYFTHAPFRANSVNEASSWLHNLPKQYVLKIRQLCIAGVQGVQSPLDRDWNPSRRNQMRRLGQAQPQGPPTALWGPISTSPPGPKNGVARWRQDLIDEIRAFTKIFRRSGLRRSAVLVALPMQPLSGRTAWVGLRDLEEGWWEQKQVLGMVWFMPCSVHASTGSTR